MVEEEKAQELVTKLGRLSETDYNRIIGIMALPVTCECSGGGAVSGKADGNCKCPHGAGA